MNNLLINQFTDREDSIKLMKAGIKIDYPIAWYGDGVFWIQLDRFNYGKFNWDSWCQAYQFSDAENTISFDEKDLIPSYTADQLYNFLPEKLIDSEIAFDLERDGNYIYYENQYSGLFRSSSGDNTMESCIKLILELKQNNLI